MRLLTKILLTASIAALSLPAAPADSKASRYYEDALSRYERKDLSGAIVQLKNAIQADQKMLAAHMLLGKALLASGDPIGAEVEFEESLRQGVSRTEVVPLLGQAYLLQGKYDVLLERVTAGGLPLAQQVDVLVLRANAQAERENTPVALKTLDEALLVDPRSVAVRLAQATLNMRQGNLALANKQVDEALSMAPNNAAAWNIRGSLQQSAGDRQSALASYTKASTLQPEYLDPRLARAGLLLDLGRVDEADRELLAIKKIVPLEPRASYLRALIATRLGDKGAARAALEEVTRLLDPVPVAVLVNNKQMLLLNATAHYDLGNKEKSSDKLSIFLRRYPGDSAGTKLLARLYLDAGNHSGAIILLEPLRRRTPNDPRTLALLGIAYMQAGNHQGATELLDQAVRHSGGAADIRTDFGISLASSGKVDQAIAQLDQAWAADNKQSRTGMFLSSLYLRVGQPKKALEVSETMARSDSSNPAVLNMLGIALVATGDRAGGRKAYEKVLARNPGHSGAVLNLSSLDMAEGKPEAARQRLLGLLKADEKNIEAMMELASIEEKANRPDEAARWLDRARVQPKGAIAAGNRLAELHLRTGAIDKALEVAKEVLLRAPENLTTLGLVARAQLVKGDSKAARQTLTDMARYANYDPAAQLEVARLQVLANNASGANYSLEKALSTQPDFLPALILLTEIEIRQREFAKAEQRIKQIGAKSAGEAIALRLQGDLAMARGQQNVALTAYANALKKDDSADMALRLFRAHAAAADLAKGAAFLKIWLKKHPDNALILRTIGDAELQLGNLAAARTAYESLLKLQPDEALVWNNLAHVASAQNDKSANSFAERAYALRPNDPVVIDTLGWLLFRQGQVDRGLALLRDARLRASSNPEIRYHLAAALAKSGRTAEAREEVAQALKMASSFPGIEDARRLQNELSK
ncbi:MAG: PEP-CTERM system TPR-repeat protein PrsT [Betaproteobacteria bacterium HGW-Betaproteobacteria-7]|jgi:putative PEP-CTERM system TPR-repeat lipoprotein|nr:MAG: PEP-CTERM system TPR-repeat protein PrsT [Betaproteobacteria bacterium HGW-Betaproteobacteria-7]